MPKYDIQRWDAVLVKNNVYPMPMLYIKPDKELLDIAKANDFSVIVNVEDTGTQYDGKPLVAVVDSSLYFPNYRPNFYNDTNFLTLTLASGWFGYPQNGNGKVTIQGLKGENAIQVPSPQPFQAPKPIKFEGYADLQAEDSCDMMWLVFLLLAVFLMLSLFSYLKRKKD